MNNPLVSISVPVYNAEKYLRKCLDSLVNQTLKNIEIVIVDDGSTDGSASICREYAERDSRILLIFKENGGLASARQAALEAANGRFFCACDADDWAEPTMYDTLYRKAMETNADIVMCDYWCEYPDGKQTEKKYQYELIKRKDLLDALLNGRFPKAVWNKLIRRDFLKANHLSWEQGIDMGEDFLLTMKMLLVGATVANTGKTLYHYRRERGGTSYTNNITMASFNQSLAITRWAEIHIDKNHYAKGLHRILVDVAYTGLRVRSGMTSNYYKESVLDELPFDEFVKLKGLSLKSLLILLVKLIGYKRGKWIVKHLSIFYR